MATPDETGFDWQAVCEAVVAVSSFAGLAPCLTRGILMRLPISDRRVRDGNGGRLARQRIRIVPPG